MGKLVERFVRRELCSPTLFRYAILYCTREFRSHVRIGNKVGYVAYEGLWTYHDWADVRWSQVTAVTFRTTVHHGDDLPTVCCVG